MLYGCQYYRPAETFHLPTRKFFEQEVFKTEKHMGIPLSEVKNVAFIFFSFLSCFSSIKDR